MDKNEYMLKIAELEMAQSNQMLEWLGNVAKIAFTSLITINGAAIVSLLTFIGNSKFIKHFSQLWVWAISSYCGGILFVLLSIMFSFWSQKIFREGFDSDTSKGKETDINTKNKYGIRKRTIAIIFALLSVCSFISGCIFSLCALSKSFV